MTDTPPTWKRAVIASPCINVCVIHPAERICTGCLRTTDEITAWSGMTPETRASIMDELPSRAYRLKLRRGGRAAKLAKG